ncbi:hypothetical protein GPECTOR_2g1061 [Gonium pectorale]|uniref:E3 UFM1-protein ligase 1 homolog n=1 Tax=Gonium pectorale TaxID=33097 RepID=A0A150H0K5_GONPE|nr:hypothetical protein GPECTOR_2g1061 [Gonium pectorale]|eukprot:KXZ55512.1 hypothetical protein GPECTOR_2g1061 [Gonium pectorale]
MEAALGLDLGALLTQLAVTQQASSSAKLSERNVVELINKLRQLGILEEGELLHTLNGKEYLTVNRLRTEIRSALRHAGGRLALVELPTIVGVDLVHCERQAAAIVAESAGGVLELQGELITSQYFDSIAVEINDQLQEAGQLSVGELAAQYGLATELVMNVVTTRLGSTINGRLEGGLLYTQSYLRAIKAQLRGALRATASPVMVLALLRDAGLGPGGGGGGGADVSGGSGLAAALASGGGGGVIATLIEELVQEGSLRGSLRGGGTSWLPAVHAEVQAEAVANFYSQNGWVAYDTVKRMGISGERAYLRSAFPDGIPLESAFVAPSLLASLEAAVEEAVAAGAGWVDVGPLLPSALSAGDVAALLGRVPLLKEAERKPARERKAHVVGRGWWGIGGTWVISAALLAQLQERADAEARAAAHEALQQRKASGAAAGSAGGPGGASAASAGGGGKRKGGGGAAAADDDDEDWSMGAGKKGAKGKKGGAGGKGGTGGGKGAAGAAGGKGSASASAGAGGHSGSAVGITASLLASHLPTWCPDMDWEAEGGGGGGEEDKAAAVAELLLGGAVAAYEQALQAAFTAGAEERRRARDALARQFEEAFSRLQLYGTGAEGFAADEATYTTLQRHALRTTGAECVDLLHRWARVEYGGNEGAEGQAAPGPGGSQGFLTAAEVKQVVRSVPADVAEGLMAAAEAPGAASVRDAEPLLERAAGSLGIRVKKLDKKGEKAALAALRERLLGALAGESDPPSALAAMVPLAYMRVTGKALTLPGKALGPVLAKLQAAAEPGSELAAAAAGLAALHAGVVDYLRAQSGSSSSAETGAMLERLSAQLPPLKSALGLAVAGGDGAAVDA